MTCIPHRPPVFLPWPARTDAAVFGLYTLELLTPDGQAGAPALPDWELRAWPVARLGDATLEARPRRPHLGPADLDRDLRRAGYTPLGPVRPARSGAAASSAV